MKKTIACATLAALAGLCAHSTQAAPVSVTLTLQPTSTVSVTINALGGITTSVQTSLSGTQGITLTNGETRSPSGSTLQSSLISLDGGSISLADASLTLSLGPLGSVIAGFQGAGLNGLTSTGNIPLNYLGGFNSYNFDPGDPTGGNITSTSLGSGLLTYNGTGTIGLLLGGGTLDFGSDPVSLDLPSLGDVASLSQSTTLLGVSTVGMTLASTYNVDVLLSAPISVSQTILTDPLDVAATLQGQIVATGSYLFTVTVPIPEPSSFVLMGIAAVGLIPLVRRLRKK